MWFSLIPCAVNNESFFLYLWNFVCFLLTTTFLSTLVLFSLAWEKKSTEENRRKDETMKTQKPLEEIESIWVMQSLKNSSKVFSSSPFKDNQTFPPRLIAFNFFHQRSNQMDEILRKKAFLLCFFLFAFK